MSLSSAGINKVNISDLALNPLNKNSIHSYRKPEREYYFKVRQTIPNQ